MKIRQAKKILFSLKSKRQRKRLNKLRPSYIDGFGRTVFPSWHNIDEIRRACNRLNKYFKYKLCQ